MNDFDEVLRLEALSVSFARKDLPTEVIQCVSLNIRPTEILALVGESGCGKSTTALAVAGLLPERAHVTKGRLWIAGRELDLKKTSSARTRVDRSVVLVPQEALSTLHPIFKIGTQLALVSRRATGRLPAVKQFVSLLEKLGFSDPSSVLQSRPRQLSGGMRQRIAIALALLSPADLIIADEPTTALDPVLEQSVMATIIGHAQETRKGVLWISHNIHRVRELADRVAVMLEGRIVAEGIPSDVMHQQVHPYVDSLLQKNSSIFRASFSHISDPRELALHYGRDATLLKATALTKSFAAPNSRIYRLALDNVSVGLRKGEILSIVGASGSGKTTLALCLTGLLKPDFGSVEFDGQNIDEIPLTRLSRRLQILFQDPFAALDPQMTVKQLLEEPLRIIRMPVEATQQKMADITDLVGLPSTLLSRKPVEISAGQRQRVALGRALVLQPSLLICDEPLASLDAVAQFDMLSLLIKLQRELDLSLVFITHDFGVACNISQQLAVLSEGVLVDSGGVTDLLANAQHPWTKKLISITNSGGFRRESTPGKGVSGHEEAPPNAGV